MNLVQITPGAGGMYCGNCFRDNALVAALRRLGHDTVMVPLYLPMTLDESATSGATPTFFGGINVFLSQKVPWHRRAPAWFRHWFDAPALLRWASGRAAKTRASDVGELNLSMLLGEAGNQTRELDDLIGWMRNLPKPDAVFLSNALLAGFARRIRESLGTRVYVFLQSEAAFLDSMPEPWRSRSWDALAQRAADVDGWIAPSRFFGQLMADRVGFSPSRLEVVPNGISLAGYDQLPTRAPLTPGGPLTLGFLARQCADKGLDLVVDAFIELRRNNAFPQLRLKVGGGCGPSDEPFVARQQAKLAQAGLGAAASFHPNVSREDKIRFYASCDVLSVPARPAEAFGLYVIESLAAGTPLVQPSVGTYPELLAATGGGVLSGPNDASSLAQALRPLLAQPARLREIGETGRRAVFERYTDDAMARNTVAAVERLGRG
jgi:glycosyltransferase involved in cell wall biosynthesis